MKSILLSLNYGGTILETMKKEMDASDEIRIKYASNYAGWLTSGKTR
jgi:hypothetical protein